MSIHGVTRKGNNESEVSQPTIHYPALIESQHPQASDHDCLPPGARLLPRKKFHGTLPQRLSRLFWGKLLGISPRLHGIAIEICSLPWRSEFQSRLHSGRLSVEFGLALEKTPNGHGIPNRRTHARIADTESFVANCPKATLFERWVFLQGWNMGERYALRSSDTREMDGGSQA